MVTDANRKRSRGLQILEAPDHARAVEMVATGEADAFVMDDVPLYALAANRANPRALKVVDDEMRRLIQSTEIYTIYDKWFQKPIPPKGVSLNMPVSYLLKDFWKYPTDFVPF